MERPRVKLDDIIEGIEMSGDESQAYLDLQSGRIEYIDEQTSWAMRDDEDQSLPDWQRPLVEIARLIKGDEDGERFLALPNQFEANEWQMMAEFAAGIDDDAMRDELSHACRRSGAFRYFKAAVHRLGVADEWYAYRDESYYKLAADWCEANEIPFEPKSDVAGESFD